LGLAWKQYTGLPFVFAAWVSNQPIPAEFISVFDAANGFGLSNLDRVIAAVLDHNNKYDLQKYYTENISYEFSVDKKEGLNLFLELLKTK
jgi:chorismate dehydratase